MPPSAPAVAPNSTSSTNSSLSKADYESLAEFRYRLRRFLRRSEELAQEQGITPLQYLLLLQLRGFPGRNWATIAELAERLQSHHHGVVALVARCEKAGLIGRRAGREDRRCVEVFLLPKAEALLDTLAPLHARELAELSDVLSWARLMVDVAGVGGRPDGDGFGSSQS